MNDSPLVSVLMTSYNREKYIGAAIESVLASTYRNLELIVVDDRSKDSTVQIARSYAEKDNRVHVYINEHNLGDYPNRNQAAAHAKGKYIKYVDADDLVYPHGLELLVYSMERYPEARWGLCSLDQDEKRIFPFVLSPKEAYEYHYLGTGLFHKAPLSAIIRRDLFQEVGGFKPIRMAGDNEMWHRLAQHHPVLLMQHGIVWYRKHDAQEMTVYHTFREVYRGISSSYLKDKNCPLDQQTSQQILRKQQKLALKGVAKNLLMGKFAQAGQELTYYRTLG